MRKMFTLLSILVLASLLAACGAIPTGVVPTQTARVVEVIVTATPPLVQVITSVPVEPTLVPTGTPTALPTEVPTKTVEPTLAPTATPAGPQLRTAEDVRKFFSDIEGWVSGGDQGQWVAGAQGTLEQDLSLKDMPEGMVFEFECVQYSTFSGEIQTKKVCTNATSRYSEVVPGGSFGTIWLEWAIQGSDGELWKEGFVNKPCKCPSGDCRIK